MQGRCVFTYNDLKYWIWLQCCLGVDNKRLKTIIETFKSAENIYNSDENAYRTAGIFSKNEILKLCDKRLEYSEKTVYLCEKSGYKIIPYKSAGYPKRLAETPSPPVVLYVLGELPSENELHVGMVGTRNAGETGMSLSYNFSYDLSKNNAVIVSGGAYGVDIYSHKGSVDAGGKTVCVIGCGIDRLSGSSSDFIRSQIPKSGAIVSEYPPGYPATRYTFPMRDRIISGMSDCTLVVRAGLGSGALITVKYAIEQKRKVFAVPADAANLNGTGVNYLIGNGFSAALVYSDILDWYEKCKGRIDRGDPNPPTDGDFMRTMAIKAEQALIRTDSGRKIKAPAGYQMMTDLSKREICSIVSDSEQMKISDSMPDTDDGKINDAQEFPLNGMNEGDGEISEAYVPNGSTAEYTDEERENDIRYMNEMFEREIAGEPEPPSSPAFKIGGFMTSDYEKRAYEIRRIILKYNLDVGLDVEVGRRVAQKALENMGLDFAMNELEKADEKMRPYIIESINKMKNAQRNESEKTENSDKSENSSENPKKSRVKRKYDKKTVNTKKSDSMEKSDKKTSDDNAKESKIGKNEEKNNKILSGELTENASTVYYTISDTPVHVNDIKTETGLDIGDALSALAELQVYGLVTKLPGGRYIKNQ